MIELTNLQVAYYTRSNMSHWKKARPLTLRFRPIFHLLAIMFFLSYPLPLQTSS